MEQERQGSPVRDELPSDETILRILRAMGYEDDTWVRIIKERLKEESSPS